MGSDEIFFFVRRGGGGSGLWVLVVVEGGGYGELTGAFIGRVGGGREVESG